MYVARMYLVAIAESSGGTNGIIHMKTIMNEINDYRQLSRPARADEILDANPLSEAQLQRWQTDAKASFGTID
jgi:hypothetical protein